MLAPSVKILDHDIIIDGKPRQIIAGAIHYFRSLPGQWDSLLEKAKAMGLDAVETYVAWNMHEPAPGKYEFSGRFDVENFLRLAQKHKLLVILRPGPYICAEWNNGGFPVWLTSRPGCRIRRDNPIYMAAVEKWFGELLPRMAKYQYTQGGPIILAAVENEYGNFGSDHVYLEKLRTMFIHAGFDIPLITADGGGDQSLVYGGMIPECAVALTMGPGECLKKLALKRTIRPDGPDMCMEYWCGMFDQWGAAHRQFAGTLHETEFEAMVAAGASVNLYMFHGGTNFGFTAGANYYYGGSGENGMKYASDTTSYDYDAPLDEAGDITPKYERYREILRKYRPEIPERTFAPSVKKQYASVPFTGCAPLFSHWEEIGTVHHTSSPETMETVGQSEGFMLYRTEIQGPCGNVYPASIGLWKLHDRAQVFLDHKFLGDFSRNDERQTVEFRLDAPNGRLDVLVENLGYVNFGPACGQETKGVEEVLVGAGSCHFTLNFECIALPMNNLSQLTFEPMRQLPPDTPAFYRTELTVNVPANTWLKFPGKKGFVTVNGFNLGRYWDIGPGDALFLPGELLRSGKNEIIIFEQYTPHPMVEFSDRRNWGDILIIKH